MTAASHHYLFSYGTLQLESVQLQSFGRLLQGEKDGLPGYRLEHIKIENAEVLRKSQQEYHPMAVYTGNTSDIIYGVLFLITGAELDQADQYEVDDYKRREASFVSGKKDWVYVWA